MAVTRGDGLLAGLWVLVPSLIFAAILWNRPVEFSTKPSALKNSQANQDSSNDGLDSSALKEELLTTVSNVTSETHLPVKVKTENPKVQVLWFYPTSVKPKELENEAH